MRSGQVLALFVGFSCLGSAQDSLHQTQRSVEPAGEPDIVMNFAGDCTFADHFETAVGDSVDSPFAALPWFGEADISMVNLENPITIGGKKIAKEFNFCMHPKYLQVLLNGGVDIVTLANNHIYDFGKDGLFDTMRYLDSVNVKYVGAGKNIAEARRPAVFDVRGVKIGFLAYYGNGDWHPATEAAPGTAPRYRHYIEEDIQRLRKDGMDFVVVNYHWGEEKSQYPDGYQIGLARFTIDAGADLVIGHHPHVLQGIERYKHGIIAYSLGNFIFGGHSRPEYDTAVFQVRIRDKQMIPKLIPVRVSLWRTYPLKNNDGERLVKQVMERSRIFQKSIFD